MSINEVRYLPECGSTNAYVKEHFEEFGPVGAVYTENQTAGRGRLVVRTDSGEVHVFTGEVSVHGIYGAV